MTETLWLSFPLELRIFILREWLNDLQVISTLDIACSGTARSQFLETIRHPSFNFSRGLDILPKHSSSNYQRWVLRRMASASKLLFPISLAEARNMIQKRLSFPTASGLVFKQNEEGCSSLDGVTLSELLSSFSFPNLTSLDLSSWVQLEATQVRTIAALHLKLQRINLFRHPNLSAESVSSLITSCSSSLQTLSLEGFLQYDLSDSIVDAINDCTNLQSLRLFCEQMSDESLAKLVASHHSSMTSIKLAGRKVTDNAVITLVRANPQLETLHFQSCFLVTAVSMNVAIKTCVCLRKMVTPSFLFKLLDQTHGDAKLGGLSTLAPVSLDVLTKLVEESASWPLPLGSISFDRLEGDFSVLVDQVVRSCSGTLHEFFLPAWASSESVQLLVDSCPQLSRIHVEISSVENAVTIGSHYLLHSLQPKWIRSLTFFFSILSDDSIIALVRHCEALETLVFSSCPNISDRTLIALQRSCPLLCSLVLHGTECSAGGLVELLTGGQQLWSYVDVGSHWEREVGDQLRRKGREGRRLLRKISFRGSAHYRAI